MKLVKEHINFERGLDPKRAMDIGITQQQFIKWLDELRVARSVGSIILKHVTTVSPWWLEIAYYGEINDFEKCIKQFPDNTFIKIKKYHRNHQSWQYQINLLINPEYEKYFRNAFTEIK